MYFMLQAVENVLRIGRSFPVNTSGNLTEQCFCEPAEWSVIQNDGFDWSALDKDACLVSKSY